MQFCELKPDARRGAGDTRNLMYFRLSREPMNRHFVTLRTDKYAFGGGFVTAL